MSVSAEKLNGLIGQKFNNLTIIGIGTKVKQSYGRYLNVVICKCDCGVEKEIILSWVKRGKIKSCGCLNKFLKPVVGSKFNMLTIVSIAENKRVSGQVQSRVVCKCDCGNVKELSTVAVIRGGTKSCGCLLSKSNRRLSASTHGLRFTPIYKIWKGMKARCFNTKSPGYKDYGGRGITVCNEWRENPVKFIEWAERNGYGKGLQIDRINNNGNYEPANCGFVTPTINSRNRRSTIYHEYKGEIKTVPEWSEITGLGMGIIYNRLKSGWDFCKIINTPVELKYSHKKINNTHT